MWAPNLWGTFRKCVQRCSSRDVYPGATRHKEKLEIIMSYTRGLTEIS